MNYLPHQSPHITLAASQKTKLFREIRKYMCKKVCGWVNKGILMYEGLKEGGRESKRVRMTVLEGVRRWVRQ